MYPLSQLSATEYEAFSFCYCLFRADMLDFPFRWNLSEMIPGLPDITDGLCDVRFASRTVIAIVAHFKVVNCCGQFMMKSARSDPPAYEASSSSALAVAAIVRPATVAVSDVAMAHRDQRCRLQSSQSVAVRHDGRAVPIQPGDSRSYKAGRNVPLFPDTGDESQGQRQSVRRHRIPGCLYVG